MKKSVFPTLLLIVGLFAGCSSKEYTVTFEDGTTQLAKQNSTLKDLPIPTRENYTFSGWYQDTILSRPWTDSDKVTGDLSLYAAWDRNTGDTVATDVTDKNFSDLRTPGSQESAFEYQSFFLPALDGMNQPYVGDTMPYYEDGTYYIYYLKEGGDSLNHSAYLATTQDFVTYEEVDTPILEASRSGGQDSWIGTGSVVKVDDTYYFFYTGHTDSSAQEYKEKILVAVGDSPRSFEKKEGWEIIPPSDLGQKNDFRDPQGYYDPETGNITLTVTASQAGKARVLKFILDKDLETNRYDGIIFTDPTEKFWNLECTDTFQMGNRWYLTYSGQDDTLWYAVSDQPYGPYGEAKRLDGKLFYAAKHVQNGENSYMVGWGRRSESASSTQDVAGWAGNLVVQQLRQQEDGSLLLMPVEEVIEQFTKRRALLTEQNHWGVSAGSAYNYQPAFTCFERFMLTGEIQYSGTGSFGLAFDFNGRNDKRKLISLRPSGEKLTLDFNEGSTPITETRIHMEEGKTYSFTYVQEGSVGVFYLDGQAALTVRLYGSAGKPISLFAEGCDVTFSSLRQYTP